MTTKKPSAPRQVVYDGGSDGVVLHLASGAITFPKGVPVEVSSEDAQALAGRPDFTTAAPAAPTAAPAVTTPKPTEE